MAGQKPRSLVALSRHAEPSNAATLCCLLHHSRCAGCQVTHSRENGARPDLHDFLLPVLFSDALVVDFGPGDTGARASHDGWRNALWKSLGTLAFVGALAFVPLKVVGAESAFDCGTMPCDAFEADPSDQPSLQRGAALYASYCMGCHSLQYSRHNRVARDLGIPEDLYKANLVFDPEIKLGSLMSNSMDKGEAKVWFGATPPDLTLVARSRQPDWLYTYLRAFYEDESRPYGVNNRVYPNVGMPHVLMELQGLAACADDAGLPVAKASQCKTVSMASAGAMSAEQFDSAIYDLVNFLAYTAEPFKADRQRIGTYVLLFLVVFFIFAWLLNREYWKDVH